jgi:AcrR family transcriptional regulator
MSAVRLPSQARRAAILDTAVRLFSEKGFRGVTTRELAAAVGVSEPVLYQHFATKGDLYRAIIEERAACGERSIPSDFEQHLETVTDDRSFLIRLATGVIEWHAKDPTYARLLMFSALEQHEVSRMFYERYAEAFFGGLARYFERRMNEGAFREIDPRLAAHSFVGAAANYGMSCAIFQRGVPGATQGQVVEAMVDIFLEGLKRR